MEANKLYRVEPHNYRGNTNRKCGLLLKGNPVNITIYGSNIRPDAKTQMVDLTNAEAFVAEGAYTLSMLPTFVYFDGTASLVELIGYITTGEFAFGGSLPMGETDLTDQGYTSETIDERLIHLATLGLADTTIYLYGNEARTAASDAAVLVLIEAGCVILEDL